MSSQENTHTSTCHAVKECIISMSICPSSPLAVCSSSQVNPSHGRTMASVQSGSTWSRIFGKGVHTLFTAAVAPLLAVVQNPNISRRSVLCRVHNNKYLVQSHERTSSMIHRLPSRSTGTTVVYAAVVFVLLFAVRV